MKPLIARVQAIVARVMALRPVRVFQFYGQKNGPILAGGLSLTALYSVFAAIYVGFTVLGFALKSNPEFESAVVDQLATVVPGLIDTGDGNGALKVSDLYSSSALTLTSVIALVAVLVTALSWFASARSAVRAMFDLPQDTTFFLLLKLRDLGLVIAFAVVTLLSASISIFSTAALNFLFGLVGIDHHSAFAESVARVIGLIVALAIDTTVLALLFRVLLALPVPRRRLFVGSFLGGLALGILKVLGATIIGGGGRNPLLASFAVILGLLVWFGLVCQVILIAATWIAIDLKDHGQQLRPRLPTKRVGEPGKRPRTRAISPPR